MILLRGEPLSGKNTCDLWKKLMHAASFFWRGPCKNQRTVHCLFSSVPTALFRRLLRGSTRMS